MVICYLFLGGAGAGALFVLTALDVRSPWASRLPAHPAQINDPASMHNDAQEGYGRTFFVPQLEYQGLFGVGYTAAFAVLLLGAVCLLTDLGRIDRVITLFTHPTISLITLGTYALMALLLAAFPQAVLWLFGIRVKWRRAVRAVQILVLVFAVLVMLYTGLIFQQAGAGLLIGSPLVPALFVLSSFSAGIAVLVVAGVFTRGMQRFKDLISQLLRFDCLILALECIVAGALVLQVVLDPGLVPMAEALVQGPEVLPFWLGFVLSGLVLPFMYELSLWRKCALLAHKGHDLLGVVIAFLVLVGGFSLRWCVALAGFPSFSGAIPFGG